MSDSMRWGATAIGLGLILGPGFLRSDEEAAKTITPLRGTHAHNDYEHPRPLFDALAQGFTSVEADVFLRDGQLLIGHEAKHLRPERTLQKLYLEPLRTRAKANDGRIYRNGPQFYLLIDVKSDAEATYAALHPVLASFADILSATDHGRFSAKAVTVVISGNRARSTIAMQDIRYAGIDGRAEDLSATEPADLLPWISDRWGKLFRWTGNGPLPPTERTKLDKFVQEAHRHGRQVRFWATPERPEVWRELRLAGVDWLNTDRLAEMRQFLIELEGPGAGKKNVPPRFP